MTKLEIWDASVGVGNRIYSKRMHNLCCDNCHSHVARCLNTMLYDGKDSAQSASVHRPTSA